MDTFLAEAEKGLIKLINHINASDTDQVVAWPPEIINDKNILETYRDLLSIIQAIFLKAAIFSSDYCKRSMSTHDLKHALEQCCDNLRTVKTNFSCKKLEELCESVSDISLQLATFDLDYIDQHNLSDFSDDVTELQRYCKSFNASIKSLNALKLADDLKETNENLKKFKDKLDKTADATGEVAAVAAFLGKLIALVAKLIPFIV